MAVPLEKIVADLRHHVDSFISYRLYDEDLNLFFSLFERLIDQFSEFLSQ